MESAGARVLAVPFDIEPKELKKLMSKLNGIYIPGDHSSLVSNGQYSRLVAAVVQNAQSLNEEEGNHFPVAAFEYGALTLLQDALKSKGFGAQLDHQQVDKRFHYQALKHPDQTFLFDSVAEADLQETFLRSTFYN